MTQRRWGKSELAKALAAWIGLMSLLIFGSLGAGSLFWLAAGILLLIGGSGYILAKWLGWLDRVREPKDPYRPL